MSGSADAYIREMLRDAEVSPERVAYILGEMHAGREWHPKTYGEVRAALGVMVHAMEHAPAAVEALPFVGKVLAEDCIG